MLHSCLGCNHLLVLAGSELLMSVWLGSECCSDVQAIFDGQHALPAVLAILVHATIQHAAKHAACSKQHAVHAHATDKLMIRFHYL